MRVYLDTPGYRTLPPAVRRRFDEWLRDEGLDGHKIVDMWLGEGEVTVTRLALNDAGKPFWNEDRSGPATIVVTLPVESLPPAEAFE